MRGAWGVQDAGRGGRGYPEGDARTPGAARGQLPCVPPCPGTASPARGAAPRHGRGSSGPARPGPARGAAAGLPLAWGARPGKAAAEIYDAGGQSVKAVYHHQVGLKERKHIFNKKRGFAIQLRC